MNYDEVMNIKKVTFGDMPPQPFLLGLLSAFDNRYQASSYDISDVKYMEPIVAYLLEKDNEKAV